MVDTALAAIEASAVAHAMRRSVWLYPVANVVHVLGLMAFFAAVAAMDVKALGTRKVADLRAVIARLRPLAIGFLLLQAVTGVMLFLPEATHVADNPAFQVKLAAIALALTNVLAFEAALRGQPAAGAPSAAVKVFALASLFVWLAIAALGRLIAYF